LIKWLIVRSSLSSDRAGMSYLFSNDRDRINYIYSSQNESRIFVESSIFTDLIQKIMRKIFLSHRKKSKVPTTLKSSKTYFFTFFYIIWYLKSGWSRKSIFSPDGKEKKNKSIDTFVIRDMMSRIILYRLCTKNR
jgi:hypothetical protein